LLDRNGNIFKRYTPQTNPSLLTPDIEYLLNGGTSRVSERGTHERVNA